MSDRLLACCGRVAVAGGLPGARLDMSMGALQFFICISVAICICMVLRFGVAL